MHLSPEEMEEFLEESAKEFQKDTQFLVEQGWVKTDKTEIDGKKFFSVWRSPDGKEYPHQNSMFDANYRFAIEVAESDLVKKCGFKKFDVNIDYSYLDDPEPSLLYFYVHPENNYCYDPTTASMMVRYKIKESEVAQSSFKIAQRVNEIIADKNITPTEDVVLTIEAYRDSNTQEILYRYKGIEFK